jgi:hypothetical protein
VRRFFVHVVAVALVVGGCSGGCEGTFDPLPKPIPASQIIEGGVQVRVTKNGLKTIANAARQIIASTIGTTGVCVPYVKENITVGDLEVCYANGCAGGARGCKVNVNVGALTTSTITADTLRANVTFSGSSSIPIRFSNFLGTVTCPSSISLTNARLEVDVRVGTRPTTGELTLNLVRIGPFNINPTLSLCGLSLPSAVVDAIVSGVLAILGETDIGQLIVRFLTPVLNDFIQGLLPNPLGLEGVLNLGGLVGSVLPGINSKIEVRGVPGGYARLPAEGVSVGVIIGVNADRNTATRGASDSSEPALCVPQWSAPNLAAQPWLLPKAPGRQSYSLAPAGAFLGSPDPTTDVAIGLSQTLLDLAGHHVISSGAMCLSVGSQLVPQLNLGTVGLLIRSLSELGIGTEPILIVLRPTRPITFDIGNGSATSPYITAHVKDLEIDFYALIYERYVRAFTVAFDMDLGVNAEFMLNAQRQPVIVPILVGLDASKITVTVSNTSILREKPQEIQGVFPTVLNLFIPLLAEGLPDIPVPSFEGFTLGDLRLGKETTSQDDFLAIYASLARATKPVEPVRATTEARVLRVSTPAPERIVAYLADGKGGALPEVELELGGVAPDGGPLEWQWSINNGMWRPFTRESRLVIRDLALAVQGRHTIQVRARAAGDYETTDLFGTEVSVVIDSAAPRLLVDQVRRERGELVLRAIDLVSAERDLLWALGAKDDEAPATGYAASAGRFALSDLEALAGASGRVRVFVRDEQGNAGSAIFDLRAPPALDDRTAELGGGGCHVGAGPHAHGGTAGAIAGALLPLLFLLFRRLRGRALVVLVLGVGVTAGVSGCSTTNDLAPIDCRLDGECADSCPIGQKGYCDPTSRKCVCVTEVRIGLIGSYSAVAVSPTGMGFVSAYNSEHGDLMVAEVPAAGRIPDSVWEFADGAPSGPRVNAYTDVRGGVNEPGDDVGLYTSIAVTPTGEPVVAHYDKTNQSLRFSTRVAGVWTSHTVDAGALGSKDVGRYTAISLDGTGQPGIGYLAMVKDGSTRRSEVRWAQAKNSRPSSQADWTVTVVESRAAPPDPSMGMLNDVPFVNGVFVSSTRTAQADPVLVYHDRVGGSLKLAEWDRAASRFKQPVIVDGAAPGTDVGWYPSVAATPDGKLHIAYVDSGRDNLLTITYPGGSPEVVDDGLRFDGMTSGGLPRPVFHFVGDNSAIVVTGTTRAIVYQDATAHELLVARKTGTAAGAWTRTRLAGSETPYKGSYGFFAACALAANNEAVMSTFALNQSTYEMWVEVFRQSMP